jgi:glucokinase
MTKTIPVSVGIDLGGTSTRVGVFNPQLEMLRSESMHTQVSAGPDAAVKLMARTIDSLLIGAEGVRYEAVGIGIGSPGPINLRDGILGKLPNLPGWDGFPLRDRLEEATHLPVHLESDANAAAIAEWKLGAARDLGVDSIGMLTLGTGVGSGFILSGKVWHGIVGMGGELGHAVIKPGGWLCGCGSQGCLETYTSAQGLVRLAREVAESDEGTSELRNALVAPDHTTPQKIGLLAGDGEPAARRVFDGFGEKLGIGLANLISTLDLPLIVVGGGVASAWPFFADAMFGAIRDNSLVYRLAMPRQVATFEQDRTFVCPAALGSSAGLIGAALLPFMNEAGADVPAVHMA